MTDVILKRSSLSTQQKRYEKIVADEASLEREELQLRRDIDELISGDDTVRYSMKNDELASVKSKRQHLRQSRGIVLAGVNKANGAYIQALNERTVARKAAMVKKLNDDMPALLDAFAQVAKDVLISTAIVTGTSIHQLDLKRILEHHVSRYADMYAGHQGNIIKSLERDEWTL